MKILTRKEFLKMPSQTVFSYYKPDFFNGLMIKSSGEDDVIDFTVEDLIEIDIYFHALNQGENVPATFECSGREGLFDDEQLFAVYDKSDVERLVHRLLNNPYKG